MRVVTGGEVSEPMLDQLDDDDVRRVSLGGRGWILVEPRPGPLSDHLELAVGALTRRGFRSLVAHPERHAGGDFRERMQALVAAGALIQVTAALIAEGPAAPVMLELAALGLVHVLASDAHSSRAGRPVKLSHGVARLREVPPMAPYAEWAVREGPAAILAGEDVMPPFAPVPELDWLRLGAADGRAFGLGRGGRLGKPGGVGGSGSGRVRGLTSRAASVMRCACVGEESAVCA